MDQDDRPSLHDLVGSDENIDMVQKLIAGGANPNLEDSLGETPLHVAVKSIEDNPKIVQELIDRGADVNLRNRWDCAILHYAVVCRKPKVVEVLLKSNIEINFQDQRGGTALHYAVNNGRFFCPSLKTPLLVTTPDMDIVRNLLDHEHLNVNQLDYVGKTALVWAIEANQFQTVKILLNKNARLDTVDLNYHYTPLHFAIVCHDLYSTVALILKNASILVPSGIGKSPLDMLTNLPKYFGTLSSTLEFQCSCLKVIAFRYSVKELLRKEITDNNMSEYLERYWNEIDCMKSDIIVNDLSVFDFFNNCEAKSGFDDPVQQIYKPIIERLVKNVYPEYFCFILSRISKSKLCYVLYVTSNEKYVDECNVIDCKDKPLLYFLKIIRTGLLTKYLSHLEIFSLISAFTSLKNVEYKIDFRKHECFIKEFWDSYPQSHFNYNL